MLRPRASSRTTSQTRAAGWARNTVACPAELPPPTTATGSVAAPPGRALGGGVVDAGLLDLLHAGQVEPAVTGAGRDDHRAGGDRAAAVQLDDVVPVAPLQRDQIGRASCRE